MFSALCNLVHWQTLSLITTVYLIFIKSNSTLLLLLCSFNKYLTYSQPMLFSHLYSADSQLRDLQVSQLILNIANCTWLIGITRSPIVVNFVTKETVRRRHSIPEGHVWVTMELSNEWHNSTKRWLPTNKTTSLFRRDTRFVNCSLWGLKSIGKRSMNLFTLDDETSWTTHPSTHGHIPENLNLLPCSFFKIRFENNIEAQRAATLAILGWHRTNACRLLYTNLRALTKRRH